MITQKQLKTTSAEVLLSQLEHILQLKPEMRRSWECKLALDVYRVCAEEQYNEKLFDLQKVATKDLEKMAEKKRWTKGS